VQNGKMGDQNHRQNAKNNQNSGRNFSKKKIFLRKKWYLFSRNFAQFQVLRENA
jgi:hypothetical protein